MRFAPKPTHGSETSESLPAGPEYPGYDMLWSMKDSGIVPSAGTRERIPVPRSARWASIAAATAPPVLHFLFILRNAHGIPVWEQWYFVRIFDLGHLDRLSFLFTPYNDHLNTFPFLASFLLGRLTHWNILAEIFLGFFLLAVCFSILVHWLRELGPFLLYLLLPFVSILFFSLRSYEIIFNGFNVSVHYLSALLTLACIEFLRRAMDRPRCLFGAMIAAVFLSFSWGGGILIWPTGLVFLAGKSRVHLQYTSLWLGTAGLCVVLMQHLRDMPDYFSGIDPVRVTRFALTLFGNPFSLGPCLSGGTLILVGLLMAFVFRRQLGGRAAVWTAWGFYSLANILAISLTRSRGGIELALPSRYSFVVTPLVISLLVLSATIIRQSIPSAPILRIALTALLLLLPAAFSIRASFHSAELVTGWHDGLLAPLIQTAEKTPEQLSPGMVQELVCARWQDPETGLAIMRRQGLAVFRHAFNGRTNGFPLRSGKKSGRSPSRISCSWKPWKYDRPSRCFLLSGRACDLDSGNFPDAVFIESPKGKREFALGGYPVQSDCETCKTSGFLLRVPHSFMYRCHRDLRLHILADDGLEKTIVFNDADFAPRVRKKMKRPPRKYKQKIRYSSRR